MTHIGREAKPLITEMLLLGASQRKIAEAIGVSEETVFELSKGMLPRFRLLPELQEVHSRWKCGELDLIDPNEVKETPEAIDLKEAQKLVAEMVASGVKRRSIAAAIGTSTSAVTLVLKGWPSRFNKYAELRSVHEQWEEGTLDLTRTARKFPSPEQTMIQEMLDGGVSKAGIGIAVGVSERTIHAVISGQTKTFGKAAELKRVYEKWKASKTDLKGKVGEKQSKQVHVPAVQRTPPTSGSGSVSLLPEVTPEMIAALERRIEIMQKQVGLMRELMVNQKDLQNENR